jgi:glyoxylase-like metal-dependent hydrolase (beta-lactamase superfamily II)
MTVVRGEADDRFTVYALEYGRRQGVRGEHFLGWDAASGDRHDTSYYVWLLLSADRTILVDTGMDPDAGRTLPRWSYRASPFEILRAVGVAVEDIDTVVLTHLHYDHAGGVRALPCARVVVQRAELDYWTSLAATRISREAWLIDPRDLAHLTVLAETGRVDVAAGDTQIGPGLSAHLVGGHTAGTQILVVQSATVRVVLASDAVHFFENLQTDRPGAIVHCMPAVYSAFDRARVLAAGGPIVPGHDPEVLARFSRPDAGLPDHVVRIA